MRVAASPNYMNSGIEIGRQQTDERMNSQEQNNQIPQFLSKRTSSEEN
jgi:hypothetical protein